MTATEIEQLRGAMLNKIRELDKIVKDVSSVFSKVTALPTFGILPTIESGTVKSIKLVSIDEKTIMVIVADSSGIIKNKLLRLREVLSSDVIDRLNLVFNENLSGLTVSNINLSNIIELQNAVGVNVEILTSVLELVHEAISEIDKREVFLEGSANILRFPEYNDVERIREILNFFDDKESLDKMVKSLPAVNNGEVSVFIGDENPVEELKNNSVVLSTYNVGNNMTGIIGVVGPMRMDYSKVVTSVDFFAKQLEAMLGEKLNMIPPPSDFNL